MKPLPSLPPPFPTRRSSDLLRASRSPAEASTREQGDCGGPPASGGHSAASSCASSTGFARQRSAADRARSSSVALVRSEEHTSELQSHVKLVCRLLLEKKIT